MLPCNCDARKPEWSEDSGLISKKEMLPIKSFNYRPLDYDLQKYSVSIGSLKCRGKFWCQSFFQQTYSLCKNFVYNSLLLQNKKALKKVR